MHIQSLLSHVYLNVLLAPQIQQIQCVYHLCPQTPSFASVRNLTSFLIPTSSASLISDYTTAYTFPEYIHFPLFPLSSFWYVTMSSYCSSFWTVFVLNCSKLWYCFSPIGSQHDSHSGTLKNTSIIKSLSYGIHCVIYYPPKYKNRINTG